MHTTQFVNPVSLKEYVDRAIKHMSTIKEPYDTVAFCGMSGALVAPMIALALNKELVLVRKKGDKCNSQYKVEGNGDVKRYIIVDDFVSSGRTVGHIQRSLYKFSPKAECVGVVEVQRNDAGYPDNVYCTQFNLTESQLQSQLQEEGEYV